MAPLAHQQTVSRMKKSFDNPLLRERDAADFLNVSEATLQKNRYLRKGPVYVRVGEGPRGAIRYRLSDLEDWIRRGRVAFCGGKG